MSYVVVQKLLATGHPMAVGIGYLLQALLNAAKPGGNTPIIVEHRNKGATRVIMFGRQRLSTDFSTAVEIIRKDFGVGDFHNPGFTVTGGLFYNRDGIVQETPVPISQESWPELMAHVDKIFIRAS